MMGSSNPEIKRLLGVKNDDGSAAGFGTGIGLSEDWAVNIIKGTGNYAEIFERNVGTETPLKIARGKNALWNAGGLQYAPPIR
jgi:general L-amino acid transport system substrate-binding protein